MNPSNKSKNLFVIVSFQNWDDQVCITKDEFMLEGWEQYYSKDSLLDCCEAHMFHQKEFCCENSEGDC